MSVNKKVFATLDQVMTTDPEIRISRTLRNSLPHYILTLSNGLVVEYSDKMPVKSSFPRQMMVKGASKVIKLWLKLVEGTATARVSERATKPAMKKLYGGNVR